MIKLKSLICEELRRISYQDAIDKKLFGPVYHGTSQEKLSQIDKEGFKIIKGLYGSSGMSQGYANQFYGNTGIPAPIHHLGFGIYFTTIKSIAKKFAGGTTKGMKVYFLDIPKLEIINFGSPNTMMKWWIKNGYDPELAKQGEGGRYHATIKLTEELNKKYDGIWFKGKGIYRLLDGDQVVVFDSNNVYQIDKSLIKSGDIGSRIISKVGIDPYNRGTIIVPIGTPGIIINKQKPNELQKWAEGCSYIYTIKFKTGGIQHNILDKWIQSYD